MSDAGESTTDAATGADTDNGPAGHGTEGNGGGGGGLSYGGFIGRSPIGNHAFGPNRMNNNVNGSDPSTNAHTQDHLDNAGYGRRGIQAPNSFKSNNAGYGRRGIQAPNSFKSNNGFMSGSLKAFDDEIADELGWGGGGGSFFGGVNAASSKAKNQTISFSDMAKDFTGINNPGGFSKSKTSSVVGVLLGLVNPFAGAAYSFGIGVANKNPVSAALGLATLGPGKFGLAAAGLNTLNSLSGFVDDEFGVGPGTIDDVLGTGSMMAGISFGSGTNSSSSPSPSSQSPSPSNKNDFDRTDSTAAIMAKASVEPAPNLATLTEEKSYTFTPRTFSPLNVRRAGLRRIA